MTVHYPELAQIAHWVDLLPLGPRRSSIIDMVGQYPDADTLELAARLELDPRTLLTNLTKARQAGYLLTRPGQRPGVKGRAPNQWRLSAKGKRTWAIIQRVLRTG